MNLQRALELIHGGQWSQAEALCKQVLEGEPRNFNALQLLGHVALRGGDYAAAARWLTAARSVNPRSAAVHSNLAVALLGLQRPREALACSDGALALMPDFPEAHCNRGNALCAMDRAGDALDSYDRALAAAPGLFEALTGRVNALLAVRRYEDALAASDVVLRTAPASLEAWCLRGSVLMKLRRPQDALAAFDRALTFSPNAAEGHNNRGTALRELGRTEDALAAYADALRLRPQFAEVFCNVANIGLDLGRIEAALAHCERALGIRPDFLEALNIRGTALRVLKRYEEAAATYERILSSAPNFGQALSHLLLSRASVGNWWQRSLHAARVIERIEAGESASAPHTFLWLCESAAAQLRCARLYSAEEFPNAAPLWRGERYRHERLRVAYLSADFSDHPVAQLSVGVFERHDRSRLETVGVSLHRDPAGSVMQSRMQRAFEHFYDASDAGDRDVAQRLREQEIDIVVDLTGHTSNGRLGILAHRPAPIHINFLGYAGTSGVDYMDYLIGDAVATPTRLNDCFTERIIRMPHSFLPNDDRQPVAAEMPRRRDLGLPDSAFVFCAFNNTYKLNPAMFDVWMRLLHETPGSILWLRGGGHPMMANLVREAETRGVEARRLVFAPRMEAMPAHLARYRQADLFLDTLPYGAHATARDALWAGLPVLTCAGSSFAGRVAASLLAALGIPELVASTLEDYTMRALTFANSPGLLKEVRGKVMHQRSAAALFDTDLYRCHLESAYFAVRERQRDGAPPSGMDVNPLG